MTIPVETYTRFTASLISFPTQKRNVKSMNVEIKLKKLISNNVLSWTLLYKFNAKFKKIGTYIK